MSHPSRSPFRVARLIHHLRSVKTHVTCLGLFRGLLVSLRSALSKQPFDLTLPHPTGSGSLWLRGGTSDLEVYKKVFVNAEYDPPFDHALAHILDLGANIGLSALYFHRRFPSATIVAVEPDPENFALLERNTAHIPTIVPVRGAVWTHDGTINLIDPGIGAWGYQVSSQPGHSNLQSVPAVSMPTLLAHFPNRHCDLMKVDIEGAEKELFEEACDWTTQIEAVVIELHDRFKPGCSRALYRAAAPWPNECWKGENVFLWKSPPSSPDTFIAQ